jgi:hypothetical protein
MKMILVPLLTTLVGLLRSRSSLHLEMLALRQQLAMVANRDNRRHRFRTIEEYGDAVICSHFPRHQNGPDALKNNCLPIFFPAFAVAALALMLATLLQRLAYLKSRSALI